MASLFQGTEEQVVSIVANGLKQRLGAPGG